MANQKPLHWPNNSGVIFMKHISCLVQVIFIVLIFGCQTNPKTNPMYTISVVPVECRYSPLSLFISYETENYNISDESTLHVDCVIVLKNNSNNEIAIYGDETFAGFTSVVLEIKDANGSIERLQRVLHDKIIYSDLYHKLPAGSELGIPISLTPSIWQGCPNFVNESVICFRIGIKSSIIAGPKTDNRQSEDQIPFSPWISLKFRSRPHRYIFDRLNATKKLQSSSTSMTKNEVDIQIVKRRIDLDQSKQ